MNDRSSQAFVEARARRPGWPGIDAGLRPGTIEDGYRLQAEIHHRLAAAGNPRVGWKVGSTSAASQRSFGLSEPVYAGLCARDRSASLAEALRRPLARPSLECEILVILRQDIDGAADTDLSVEAIAAAIGACHIGCEIIDNRYGDPASVGVPGLVADDFFQAGFVVGAENTGWRDQDLSAAEAFIEIDGQRGTGTARNVLNVFQSLRWLARALARNGLTLMAGEIVLTGTITVPAPVAIPPRTVAMGITGFGTITLD